MKEKMETVVIAKQLIAADFVKADQGVWQDAPDDSQRKCQSALINLHVKQNDNHQHGQHGVEHQKTQPTFFRVMRLVKASYVTGVAVGDHVNQKVGGGSGHKTDQMIAQARTNGGPDHGVGGDGHNASSITNRENLDDCPIQQYSTPAG